ncbi:MAG: hypothetical protein FWE13_03600 [Firmicutes bacterium]|nr:hypothetical protein [Bacillota bacterium]
MAQNITTKDLTEISELLEGENLAYKKCVSYAAMTIDPVLREKFGTFACHHRGRYQKLLTFLISAQG